MKLKQLESLLGGLSQFERPKVGLSQAPRIHMGSWQERIFSVFTLPHGRRPPPSDPDHQLCPSLLRICACPFAGGARAVPDWTPYCCRHALRGRGPACTGKKMCVERVRLGLTYNRAHVPLRRCFARSSVLPVEHSASLPVLPVALSIRLPFDRDVSQLPGPSISLSLSLWHSADPLALRRYPGQGHCGPGLWLWDPGHWGSSPGGRVSVSFSAR